MTAVKISLVSGHMHSVNNPFEGHRTIDIFQNYKTIKFTCIKFRINRLCFRRTSTISNSKVHIYDSNINRSINPHNSHSTIVYQTSTTLKQCLQIPGLKLSKPPTISYVTKNPLNANPSTSTVTFIRPMKTEFSKQTVQTRKRWNRSTHQWAANGRRHPPTLDQLLNGSPGRPVVQTRSGARQWCVPHTSLRIMVRYVGRSVFAWTAGWWTASLAEAALLASDVSAHRAERLTDMFEGIMRCLSSSKAR